MLQFKPTNKQSDLCLSDIHFSKRNGLIDTLNLLKHFKNKPFSDKHLEVYKYVVFPSHTKPNKTFVVVLDHY